MKPSNLPDLFNIIKDYRFLIRMMKDKRYTIPIGRKLIYILLVLYIIVPFDFIPGIFPLIGIVDDLGAFAVIIGVLLYEITAYRDFLEGIKSKTGSPEMGAAKRLEEGGASAGPKDKRKEKR